MRRRLWIVPFLSCVLPVALSAQRVQGTVQDSALKQPLSGAVISVFDSAGGVTARTIANGSGAFALAAGSRAARLHVIRIGYFPRDIPLPADRPAGDVHLSFAMLRIPPILTTMHVSEKELCPGSEDRGAAFQLWDEARAGLLAGVVARETNPASVTALVFERHTAPRDNLVLQQQVGFRHGRTTRPFMSAATPQTFANEGYVDDDSAGGRTYNAPDDEVLLDQSFASTHCFHLQQPDAAHVGENGLAFTPAPGRDTIADVAGVIWMDAAAPALRTLDFHYTGIEPAAEDAGTGGHIEFRSMENGASFIEQWALRLPVMERLIVVPVGPSAPFDAHRRQARVGLHVAELVESGGEVLGAAWADGTSWHAPNTGLTGSIAQRGTNAPVPFALVTLTGTVDTVTADAHGKFALAPMVPGRYTVVVADTTLSRFTAARVASRVMEVRRDSVVQLSQTMQSLDDVIAGLCKDQHARQDTSIIVGHLSTPGGADLRDVEVRATWTDIAGPSGAGVAVRTADFRSSVDSKGRFLICGAGRGKSVHLTVTRNGVASDTTVVTADNSFTPVDWRPAVRSSTPQRLNRIDPQRSSRRHQTRSGHHGE
jgi:hypothetical protein